MTRDTGRLSRLINAMALLGLVGLMFVLALRTETKRCWEYNGTVQVCTNDPDFNPPSDLWKRVR